jgi:hypothetical protein
LSRDRPGSSEQQRKYQPIRPRREDATPLEMYFGFWILDFGFMRDVGLMAAQNPKSKIQNPK